MADRVERIILEVDEKGAVTATASANREVGKLEASFYRAGQTMEQRLLARIATLRGQMANDPARLKELDALQERVTARMGQNLQGLAAKIQAGIQHPMQAAGNAVGSVVGQLGTMGTVLAGAAAGFALVTKQAFDFVRAQGKLAEATENLALRTGLSVRETMQFEAAAKVAGVDISRLVQSMRLLSQSMSENSDEGAKQKRALRDIGVEVLGANRELKPTGQLLREIADRISTLPDIGAKTRALTALFGRGGSEFLPLLQRMPDLLRQVGDSWDENLNNRLSKFDDKIDLLMIKWEKLKKSLAGALIPEAERPEGNFLYGGKLDMLRQWMITGRWEAPKLGGAPVQPVTAQYGTTLQAENERKAWDAYILIAGTREEQIKRKIGLAEKDLKAAEEARDIAAHSGAESRIALFNREVELLQAQVKVVGSLTPALLALGRQAMSGAYFENLGRSQEALETLRRERLPQNLPKTPKEIEEATQNAETWRAHELDRTLDLQNDVLKAQIEGDEKRLKASDDYWEKISDQIKRRQEQRFDDLKRGFEGLFDAAFERSRSFVDALRNLFYTMFLTPVKEWLSNLMAEMVYGPRGGPSGAAGGVGGLRAIFGGLGAAASGYGGSGGVVNTYPGMPGGGGSSGWGGSLRSLQGGGWQNMARGGAMMGGMALGSYGLQRGNAAATIGGGALAGAGAASMMGMTTLGGGIAGAGFGLAAAGLQRGGWSGLGMSTAGGAIIGMQFGGPIGALIGAAIGAGAGFIRMLFTKASDKAREKIKALYGVDIQTKSILDKIVALAKQNYGGNLDMAIRTQDVRDLIELYAMSTGQATGGLPARMQPVSMVQMSGSLYRQSSPTASLTPVAAGGGGTIVIPLQMDSRAIGTVVIQNGRVIADGALKASQSNYRRTETALSQLSPNTIRA